MLSIIKIENMSLTGFLNFLSGVFELQIAIYGKKNVLGII